MREPSRMAAGLQDRRAERAPFTGLGLVLGQPFYGWFEAACPVSPFFNGLSGPWRRAAATLRKSPLKRAEGQKGGACQPGVKRLA